MAKWRMFAPTKGIPLKKKLNMVSALQKLPECLLAELWFKYLWLILLILCLLPVIHPVQYLPPD